MVGIARFAGLRRDEISALQRHWIVERNGAAHGKPMTRRISIRATAETGAAWDRIKGGDPSGVFAEMVRAYAGTVST